MKRIFSISGNHVKFLHISVYLLLSVTHTHTHRTLISFVQDADSSLWENVLIRKQAKQGTSGRIDFKGKLILLTCSATKQWFTSSAQLVNEVPRCQLHSYSSAFGAAHASIPILNPHPHTQSVHFHNLNISLYNALFILSQYHFPTIFSLNLPINLHYCQDDLRMLARWAVCLC